MFRKFPFFVLFITWYSLQANNLFVQSPKAKLLPQLQANTGRDLSIGTSVKKLGEEGLFLKVQVGEEIGYVSKLFVSPLPPSGQIKLGSQGSNPEMAEARQRASDFTKTAAARGLNETEKVRVRGGNDQYDFESLKWIEKMGDPERSAIEESLRDFRFFTSASPSVPQSTKEEVKFGRILAARLIQQFGLVKNERDTRYLNKLGIAIASLSSRSDLSFRFGILNSEQVNAYAVPGGFVFLTLGAWEKIENEAELAGILSHEISHVTLSHHGKIESPPFFLEIITSFLGPTGGEVVTQATANLVSEMESELTKKGRDQSVEFEADGGGVFLASLAGYSSKEFLNYLTRLQKNSGDYPSTHPDPKVRFQKMEENIAKFGNKGGATGKENFSNRKPLL